MWTLECELRVLGFRRRSPGYWQCNQRYGLPADSYISVFSWGKETLRGPALVEFSAFHVTFRFAVDSIHFYYHEQSETLWDPGGHTSTREIERHGLNPRALRECADRIATEVVQALGKRLTSRIEEPRP